VFYPINIRKYLLGEPFNPIYENIYLTMQAPEYNPPLNNGLDILFEDAYILAVNKPAGLLSVPGRGEDKQDCLASRAEEEFPGTLVVHRLDMATSGIVLMARDKDTQARLSALFAERQINKRYHAVVDGLVREDSGVVEQPMRCDWPNRPRQMIDYEQGKHAVTRFKVLSRNTNEMSSRLELSPLTGRTHQLRLHMQYLGHAILGDRLYGSEEVFNRSNRLQLHARELAFEHPVSGETIKLVCETGF